MRMGCGIYIWPSLMQPGVNSKSCNVDRPISLDNIPVMIYKQQIRNLDLTEVNTEWIYPKMVTKLWISKGNMPSYSLIKAKVRKQSEASRKSLQLISSCFFNCFAFDHFNAFRLIW